MKKVLLRNSVLGYAGKAKGINELFALIFSVLC
jgi:hypothetical protein